jgi:hypothetical protein
MIERLCLASSRPNILDSESKISPLSSPLGTSPESWRRQNCTGLVYPRGRLDRSGRKPPYLGAQLRAYHGPYGKLIYAGRVGTGIDTAALERLWRRLPALATDRASALATSSWTMILMTHSIGFQPNGSAELIRVAVYSNVSISPIPTDAPNKKPRAHAFAEAGPGRTLAIYDFSPLWSTLFPIHQILSMP